MSACCGRVVAVAVGDGSGNTRANTLVVDVEASVALGAGEGVCSCGDGTVADSVGDAASDGTSSLKTEVGSTSGASVDRLVGQAVLGGGGDARAGVGQEEAGAAVSTSVVGGVEGAVVDDGRKNASVVGEVAGSVTGGTNGTVAVGGTTDDTVGEAHTSGGIRGQEG